MQPLAHQRRGWHPLTNQVSRIAFCAALLTAWLFSESGRCQAPVTAKPTAAAPEAAYLQERLFFIPYQPPASRVGVAKVELLISLDNGAVWTSLQQAEPHVQGFTYHSPADGRYAFSVRTLDRGGMGVPLRELRPQLHVIVDSVDPVAQVAATVEPGGRIVLRYDVRDDQDLKADSLRMELRVDEEAAWTALSVNRPDVRQVDRIIGRAAWSPRPAALRVTFRVSAADQAGNSAKAEVSVVLPQSQVAATSGPVLPPQRQPAASAVGADRVASDRHIDWPIAGGEQSQTGR
ncbi:MAG: hypothetical protein AAF961_17290, partial [Planctomycetota bacterium]